MGLPTHVPAPFYLNYELFMRAIQIVKVDGPELTFAVGTTTPADRKFKLRFPWVR
jgi:hypothetical protein